MPHGKFYRVRMSKFGENWPIESLLSHFKHLVNMVRVQQNAWCLLSAFLSKKKTLYYNYMGPICWGIQQF